MLLSVECIQAGHYQERLAKHSLALGRYVANVAYFERLTHTPVTRLAVLHEELCRRYCRE